MAGGVVDGTPVDAANTNPKFIYKDFNDTSSGILGLNSSTVGQGSSVTSLQKEANSSASFVGKSLNAAANSVPTYVNNQGFTSNDPLFDRLDDVSGSFNNTTGHTHDGSAGSGGPISGSSLANVPLLGYILQGTLYTASAGGSTNVSSLLPLKNPSSLSTTLGVVVNTPYNKVVLRQGSGLNYGDKIEDGLGNEVYARITYSAGVWTNTYYVDLSGVETAYSFSGSQDIIWYYQELYNPMQNSTPVYSPFAFIPSDNVTADVVDASATQRGVVNTTTQTFAGVKTFNSAPVLNSLTASKPLMLTAGKAIATYLVQSGNQAISSSSQTVSVVLGTAYANTSYAIKVTFINTTDTYDNLIFFNYIVTAKSTTGFTLQLNFPANTANYSIDWETAIYV